MAEEDVQIARRKLLKGGAFALPAIVSTVTVAARAAQASCAPSTCNPNSPCSPDGGCNPGNPCDPAGGPCTPTLPCRPRT